MSKTDSLQSSHTGKEDSEFPFLDVNSVYMIYRARAEHASVVALKGVSFTIKKGDFFSVVGPSGSGKSTLFQILGGIMRPTAGEVIYEGQNIAKLTEEELTVFRRNMIGFVFQEGNLLSKRSAYDNVNEAMALNGYPYEYRKKRTLELLDTVKCLHRKNQLAFRLSGGERQRVAIARALANNPKLILADEPTGNVDFNTSTHLLELFRELNQDLGMSFLLATHSSHVAGFSDKSLEIRDGMLIGKHSGDVDLSQLDSSRMVVMDSDYRVTIPEYVVKQMGIHEGSLWMVDPQERKIMLSPLEEAADLESLSVPTDVETQECPVCGKLNPVTNRFCQYCGAKF